MYVNITYGTQYSPALSSTVKQCYTIVLCDDLNNPLLQTDIYVYVYTYTSMNSK